MGFDFRRVKRQKKDRFGWPLACPTCGSKRTRVDMKEFKCLECGYRNVRP